MEDSVYYPFQCRYFDVRHSRQLVTENYTAENEVQALAEYIHRRHGDRWTLPEIFVYSRPLLRNEVTGKEYQLNEYGELSPAGTRIF